MFENIKSSDLTMPDESVHEIFIHSGICYGNIYHAWFMISLCPNKHTWRYYANQLDIPESRNALTSSDQCKAMINLMQLDPQDDQIESDIPAWAAGQVYSVGDIVFDSNGIPHIVEKTPSGGKRFAALAIHQSNSKSPLLSATHSNASGGFKSNKDIKRTFLAHDATLQPLIHSTGIVSALTENAGIYPWDREPEYVTEERVQKIVEDSVHKIMASYINSGLVPANPTNQFSLKQQIKLNLFHMKLKILEQDNALSPFIIKNQFC